MNGLIVVATGPSATVQDLGRVGQARLGISPSGAADRTALALANRLVGNPPDAAGIEVVLGGLSLRAEATTLIALTGADAHATVGGRRIGPNTASTLRTGEVLALGVPEARLRTYVAVRGGIDVAPVLGSRSHDVLGGLGPPPLSAGDHLPIGTTAHPVPDTDWAPVIPLTETPLLRLRWGPRAVWITGAARVEFERATWTVTADLDRVGVRLSGPSLERAVTGELASEGLVRGAVQLPADGQPLIFLADHPTTGGYPVIAVIDETDTDIVAQLRPGQSVRFRAQD